MQRIVADNKIPGLLPNLTDFDLTLLPPEAITAQSLRNADILICRSVLKVNRALLDNTPVKIVATPASGIDHIDTHYLEARGIPLFSAAGSNAQGVADYILWMIAWLEKNRKLSGKRAGIIGAGHIGTKIQSLLHILGFEVLMNDPPRAFKDPHFISTDLYDLRQQDLICVHAALSREQPFSSYHLLSSGWFNELKENATLINAARGGIIDTQALLRHKKPLNLCLDVFENEPDIEGYEQLVKKCFITTPHIAGHTIESFYRATEMIVSQIKHYLSLNAVSPFSIPNIPITPIDARECQYWYDVILKLYDFHSKLELIPTTFYTLRESHRMRHDFAKIPIRIGLGLPEKERLLLKKLQLNVGE